MSHPYLKHWPGKHQHNLKDLSERPNVNRFDLSYSKLEQTRYEPDSIDMLVQDKSEPHKFYYMQTDKSSRTLVP